MINRWMSDFFEIKKNGKSREQIAQFALGQALRRVGLSYQLAAGDNVISIPKIIRVEVVEQGWDLCVKLHMEEIVDALPQELPDNNS